MALHYGSDYFRQMAAARERGAAKRWSRPRHNIAEHWSTGAILDIGCNTGDFLSTMHSWDRYGIEIDPVAAATARSITGAQVFAGTVADASFPCESFNVITCFDVLEHVYNPRELMSKVLRWLKPGGIFYLWLPNIDSWEASLFGSHWYGLELPRHLFHFSPKSLRYLMNTVGLQQTSMTTPFSYAEPSLVYVRGSVLRWVGVKPVPLCESTERGCVWRAVRKCLRTVLLRPLAAIACLAGAGAGVEAMFQKPLRTE